MTGFGTATVQQGNYSVMAQVSTINRNGLDIDISLNGRDHLFLLPDIRQKVRKLVKRGKVNVYLHIENISPKKNIVFNEPLARDIVKKIMQWEKSLFHVSTLTAGDLLRMEGIVSIKPAPAKLPQIKKTALEALKKALQAMDSMRDREGKQIARDFHSSLGHLEGFVLSIEKICPMAEKAYEKKLIKKITKSRNSRDITQEEKDIMLKMTGLFSDKIDISEEISRLKSHITQFRHYMKNENAPGKTYNFISQEMLREANTMGSKTSSMDIKKKVIRIKSLIEEIREQVANVE